MRALSVAWRPAAAWNTLWPALAWLLSLALLPWWLGLPLLLALLACALLWPRWRAPGHVGLIRRGLRWGLPGLMFALQRALGGDAFALGAALLGLLSGYTLLAGLEAWLDRDRQREPVSTSTPLPEWPELALAPVDPPAQIVELQPPAWQLAGADLPDPRGGTVSCGDGICEFANGGRIDLPGPAGAVAQVDFSPRGDWFAACTADRHGLLLWDRRRDRRFELRGWQLCGWHHEQPWLSRGDESAPLNLAAVLGSDDLD